MLLMEEAERISREEHGSSKIAVISGSLKEIKDGFYQIIFCYLNYAGVGTRNYYRKMGYKLEGPYMTKSLVWKVSC